MGKKRELFTHEGHKVLVLKKGKKHRYFIDTVTGQVVMTNPLPLLAGVAGRVLAGAAASEVASRVFSPKEKQTHSGGEKVVFDNLDKPNKGERYVSMALR